MLNKTRKLLLLLQFVTKAYKKTKSEDKEMQENLHLKRKYLKVTPDITWDLSLKSIKDFHANARTKVVTKADFTMLHALSVVALIAITTINKQKNICYCCSFILLHAAK